MPFTYRLPLVLVVGLCVAVGVLWGLGVVVEEAIPATRHNFDLRWTTELASAIGRNSWARRLFSVVTHAGGGSVTIPLAVAAGLGWLWRRRNWWAPLVLALSIGGSTAAKSIVKALIDRPRPPIARLAEATGSSFPSGHSVRAVALYGVLAVLVTHVARSRHVRAAAWITAALLIAAVAGSRVALGVHYVTDVIAGALLGVAWIAIVLTAVPSGDAEGERSPEAGNP